MPVPSFVKQAFSVFDEKITTLREFDPVLADYLETIKGSRLRKLFFSAIEGTATEDKDNPGDLQLVFNFLINCIALCNRHAEVNWICARGVTEGRGNLRELRQLDDRISTTGCDGNEALTSRYVKLFRPQANFLIHRARLNALRDTYASGSITVTPIGHSVLGVFIKPEHPGYEQFKNAMEEIAQTLHLETGQEYLTNCNRSGIRLELEDKMGRRSAILRIRGEKENEIALEIYGGNGEEDIEAQREVNSKPHGFAYKVISSRDELMADAAWGPNKLDHISGLIYGKEQWSRFLGMVAAAL